MFFADPVASFANIRKGLRPGGRLALAVFRKPAENPWATAPLAAVRHLLPPLPTPGPEDPGQFSWADPARVLRILTGAGFTQVSSPPMIPKVSYAGPGGAAGGRALFHAGRPHGAGVSMNAPEEVRSAVHAGLLAFFQQQEGQDGIVMPAAIWMVTARA